MRSLLIALVLLTPFHAGAESRLPFLKDTVPEDVELPRPWGIGVDFYTMDQHYDIDFLQFELPGVSLDDPSLLSVTNDVQHFDVKFDAWLLPFLNVFAVIGHLESDTIIDLSNAPVQGLPFPLGKLPVNTDGTVVGLGFTLAYGNENWFTSLTATRTETDLGGSFDSSVDSTTLQPRIGLVRGPWQYWVGGLYIDTEETHTGTVTLPVLGSVPFDVVLGNSADWNTAIGVRHSFSEHTELTLEVGFGDRDHTLFNFTYRF
ncbi:MAG: hypothetical protein HKN15_13780 [Xanthomonadales bacterium]|nr:hypothetical protein [Xanthomonadales bacterium]